MSAHTTELPDTSRAVDNLAAAAVAIATSPATADRGIGGTGELFLDMLQALKLAALIIGHPDDAGSQFIAATIARAEAVV